MPELIVHRASEIPFYQGPHAIPGIKFRNARQTLGVTAWGMNILELAPGCDGHPEHDHVADGQEEVYLVLSGHVTLRADGTLHELAAGDLVRVPPEVTRKLVTTQDGAVILAIGATPGAAYTATPGM